jgi:2-haloacid dehalogenase
MDFTRKDVMTFDCYGTLIDWERGILAAVQPVVGAHGLTVPDGRVLELYADLEAAAEAGPYRPYSEVLAAVVRGLGERLGFRATPAEAARLADSVGEWPAFPDTPAALAALRRRFKLAVISNVDDALFAASAERLGVDFDWVITAQQARSYKPSTKPSRTALERIGAPRERLLRVAQSHFHAHAPAKRPGPDTVWISRRRGKQGAGATPPGRARPDLEVGRFTRRRRGARRRRPPPPLSRRWPGPAPRAGARGGAAGATATVRLGR